MMLLHSAVFVGLCFTGALAARKVLEGCTEEDPCAEGLACTMWFCRAKIGTSCTALSTGECVTSAASCPAGDNPVCTCPSGASPVLKNHACYCGDDQVPNEGYIKCVPMAGQACNDTSGCLQNATCEGPEGGDRKCTCVSTMTPSEDNFSCMKKHGTPCKYGFDCIIGSMCEGPDENKTCTCKVPNADNTKCLKLVDEDCSKDTDCLPNAKCNNEKCQCKADYIPAGEVECKKVPARPGQACQTSADCVGNADCTSKSTCACKAGFSFKDGSRCGKKQLEACRGSSECVPNAKCGDNVCKCMEGFQADGDKFCVSSGASAVMASLVLLLAAHVTSRWL